MANSEANRIAKNILDQAGIEINGKNPWDIQVHNEKLFSRILAEGILGAGESYMDGWWDAEALDEFLARVMRIDYASYFKANWKAAWHAARSRIFNRQKLSRAFKVGVEHYDVGNDLYQAMLDKRMNYTCGYWESVDNLDDAQEAKLDLICQKLCLEPGMKVLEFGCGFGSFAKYAAEKYGANVLGVTVSKEQVKLGMEICKGLPVELRLEDYRSITGEYDRVVSIGILEHVGYKNYRTYMERANACLKDDGIAFIHTIGSNTSVRYTNGWSDKYIFPNGMLPSIAQIGRAMEGLFVMEDWHNFGEHYDKTLMAWNDNFENAWPELEKQYSERFRRMWRFYLMTSAASFRTREIQLWQIVMTKNRRPQPRCRIK